MLLSLTGLGRPHLEGGGINSPNDSLESVELTGVTVMEEIFRQGDESSLLRQKEDMHLWNPCCSWSDILCSSCKERTEKYTKEKKRHRGKRKSIHENLFVKWYFMKISNFKITLLKLRQIVLVEFSRDFPIATILRFWIV